MVWVVSLSTTKVSPRRLTHPPGAGGIRSLRERGNQRLAPCPCSALPPPGCFRVAVPQYISGRTSYLHVRLAFHPYPQLLPQFCNTGGCEPRRPVTVASLWPWIAHVVSGRIARYAWWRAFHTRFPCGSPPLARVNLATPMHSPDHSTKGTPSALACLMAGEWPLAAWEYVVSGSLSSPLRGAFHLSLTVLVHYRSLKVLSLGGWSPPLPTNSPGFVVLRMPIQAGAPASPTGLSPALAGRSSPFGLPLPALCGLVLQPQPLPKTGWFGLFPVRSPLLGESRLISFRAATEMFQFTACPSRGYTFHQGCLGITPGGLPHSDIARLLARMQLPLHVSPVSASFFGLQRLGILLVLSFACLTLRLARSAHSAASATEGGTSQVS